MDVGGLSSCSIFYGRFFSERGTGLLLLSKQPRLFNSFTLATRTDFWDSVVEQPQWHRSEKANVTDLLH